MSDLEAILTRVAAAAAPMAAATLADRADWLRSIADDLDADAEALIELAIRESHLPRARLAGELARTIFQLRLTADAVLEGSWLEITIDHADPDWPMGARPELRRILRPLGPVLVVAASNFPFAFSVAGGDTATALGAGCPVVLKAHHGHLELSRRTAALIQGSLGRAGAPQGAFEMIEDEEGARVALADRRVKAGSFTGSVRGGRALFEVAVNRPDPVPFYGELGSVNPAFVLRSALEKRRGDVLQGFVDSFTLGVGQFCTKPGVLFLPRTDGILDELAELVGEVGAGEMLNARIAEGYLGRLTAMGEDWAELVAGQLDQNGCTPSLYATDVEQALARPEALYEESFGPTAVLVSYDDPAQLLAVAELLPGQLTVTVQADDQDPHAASLLAALTGKAGRIVWNGWPTGVSVTWAMQHGGGWPATTASIHTSVGPTGLRRFVSPVAYQDVPALLLPPALRENNPWSVWRRVDGELSRPAADDAR